MKHSIFVSCFMHFTKTGRFTLFQSGLSSSTSQPNITDSSGFTAPVTTAPLSFSLPPSSSGSLFKNLGSSNTVLAVDSGVTKNLFGSPTAKKQEESREVSLVKNTVS